MTCKNTAPKWALRLSLLLPLMVVLAACSGAPGTSSSSSVMRFASAREEATETGIDAERRDFAIAMAKELRSRGQRVWCVPFARNVSGIELRGNARTWWSQASGVYQRSKTPKLGAVMAFSPTRKMPLGHVAVVSGIVSEREIRIDHANWRRNQISLGMTVIDVSKSNDWSSVRVVNGPNSVGRPYPVSGFIFKDDRAKG